MVWSTLTVLLYILYPVQYILYCTVALYCIYCTVHCTLYTVGQSVNGNFGRFWNFGILKFSRAFASPSRFGKS